MSINNKIITIDGPSASGKGTIAKKIANILEFKYLDSGALYRVLAYISTLIKNEETSLILNYFSKSEVLFTQINNIDTILLNQQNISEIIRTENIGKLASILATNQQIRSSLLDWQRNFATEQGLVTDGRDMGTVVFPHAQCKIFLIADVEKRAQRRYQQLLDVGELINYDDVLNALKQRDDRDINRATAPLVAASNALILDNSNLTIEETINLVLIYFIKE